MTKNYTHNAIYFAFGVFLSVSIGAISSVKAESAGDALSAVVPLFKKKTSKRVVEEVVEVETESAPKKTVFVRRRKDPIILPRANPFANGNRDVFALAHLGPHQELPDDNAGNEASSTVDLDGLTTSSVVLDQDQPQNANVSAAAGSESAANADETALLKAEIESLKAQLLSEKKKAAQLTVDLVRAKEKASELTEAKQASKAEVADVAEDTTAKPASPATDVAVEKVEEKEPETAQAAPIESEKVATEKPADVKAVDEDVAEIKGDETAKIEELKIADPKVAESADSKVAASKVAASKVAEPAELKVAEPKEAVKEIKATAAETPAVSDIVDNDTAKLTDVTKEVVTKPEPAEATTQLTDAEESAAQTLDTELAGETQTAQTEAKTAKETKEETKVALAPTNPVTREVQEAPEDVANPDAANVTLNEGEDVAEIDPALLLPFPRENPFPRVVPKVAKGPLYIKLPPVNDTYNMYVLGDSLGSGLWQGLHQNFRGEVAPSVKIVKKAKANTGIVRSDRFDWMKNVEKIANGGGFQIAVMMFGANDAQTIRLKGKRHHFGTPAWEQIYRQRIDRMIRALKRQKIAIYWVGLPNVRIPSLRKNYIHFNAIFKEKAEEHGIQFIETWDVTNDANGNWQSSGKTVRGKKAVLRAKDGTHFTSSGYRLLAQFPEQVLRPDINQARANRLAKGLRYKGTDG